MEEEVFTGDFQVTKTARYSRIGGGGTEVPDSLWFVLHGYGQLSPYFIRPFRALASPNTCIIAPEALSRFYVQGSAGRVGASWMTKEDREKDIADYVRYLDDLAIHILGQWNTQPARVGILGFSQGAATACRWAALGDIVANDLVLWGSELPADGSLDSIAQKPGMRLWYVQGDQDEIVSPEKFDISLDLLRQAGIPFQHITYPGGHKVDVGVLKRMVNE